MKDNNDEPDGTGKISILVVEDNWQIADAISAVLSGAGFIVIGPVGTEPAALRRLEDTTPDLAIVDLNLHDLLSFTLLHALIERKIKVLVTTGYQDQPELKALNLPVLSKPVDSQTLLQTVHDLLARRLN